MADILLATLSYDPDRGGGGVRLAYDLATGLAQRGHKVSVVCEDLHGSGVAREVIEGVTVLRYQLPRSCGVAFRRHEQHIAAAMAVMRMHLLAVPQAVHGHSLFQYVAALRLYKGRSRFCYVIHSPFVDELRITWGAQGAIGRCKAWLGMPTIRRLELEALRNSSSLVAESDYTRCRIRQHYGATLAERIQVVPGWVDPNRFTPLAADRVDQVRRQLGWPVDRPVFFVLRRLEARMGLDNFLRALGIVRQRGYVFHAVIGGSGSQLARLTNLCHELRLEREVTFMGFVPGAKLALAYGACDASVVPTSQLECFGIIALEALACGRPALVTPVGALPEVMQHFEPKWIARGHAPEDIADLLSAYLAGGLPVHTVGALRETVSQRYSFPRALDAYELIVSGCQESDAARDTL